MMNNNYVPENDFGNIEYKLKLTNISNKRFEELVTQMRYRLNEGLGEAIYIVGLNDDGNIIGITNEDMDESYKNLTKIATENQSEITIISKKKLDNDDLYCNEYLIRELNNSGKYIDIKIAIAGNVDVGKSSLIGVLSNNKLDNGRGSARINVFNHKHEIDTGRTSSISHQIMGFDVKGDVVNKNNKIKNISWPDIVKSSSKVVTFYDMAGHEKYLRTTISGFSSIHPDYAFIIVGANMGITHITKEHISLSVYNNIPFTIIFTKIDIAPKNILEDNINKIKRLIKTSAINKKCYSIRNNNDLIIATKYIKTNSIIPIIQLSNVTGEGLDLLEKYINLLPSRIEYKPNTNVEFIIDDIFTVSGCGTIIAGLLHSGEININDNLYIGPDQSDYSFKPIQIRSIHFKRLPVKSIHSGQYGCLCIKKYPKKHLSKGMVVISNEMQKKAYIKFKAEIQILKSNHTTIKEKYQSVLHINSVRQSARITNILDNGTSSNNNSKVLRTGDKATVIFQFMFKPEFIKPGYKIMFREGKVHGIGVIKELFD